MELPQRDVGIGRVSGYVRAKDGGSCDAGGDAGGAVAITGSGAWAAGDVAPAAGKPSFRQAGAGGSSRWRSTNGSVAPGGGTPTGAAGCRNNSARLIPPNSTPLAKTIRAPSTGKTSLRPLQDLVMSLEIPL